MKYLCFKNENDLKLLTVGRFVAVEDYIHAKRNLDDAVLILGFDGECPITQDGKETILKKGDYRILFPNITHCGSGIAKSGQSHFWCHFNLPKEYIVAEETKAEEFRQRGYIVIPEYGFLKDYSKFFVLFSQLIDSTENEISNQVIRESYLKILLCSICDNFVLQTQVGSQRVTAKLQEWVRFKNYKNVTVSEAARELGYNANYLSRVIKLESGLTPVEFINKTRVKAAKNLLINSNMKVSDIADICGFSDEKYFFKVFKKHENITPGQYRNAFFRKNFNKV